MLMIFSMYNSLFLLLIGTYLSSVRSFHSYQSWNRLTIAKQLNNIDYNNLYNEQYRQPQLLRFREPKTNINVVLVGAMHYNPVSIALTTDIVATLGDANKLASVIIESCPTRWNRTLSLQSSINGEIYQYFLNNEMVTAHSIANIYNCPVILGDQCINSTNARIGKALKSTIIDLLTPFNGGWDRLYNDVNNAVVSSLPSGDSYLGINDFFDLKLLLNTPISLIRYPLAFLIKSPISGSMMISILLFSSYISSLDNINNIELTTSVTSRLIELFSSISIFILEVALLSRAFIVTILEERNVILSQSIINECEIAYKKGATI